MDETHPSSPSISVQNPVLAKKNPQGITLTFGCVAKNIVARFPFLPASSLFKKKEPFVILLLDIFLIPAMFFRPENEAEASKDNKQNDRKEKKEIQNEDYRRNNSEDNKENEKNIR
jgi:hypothetical protein